MKISGNVISGVLTGLICGFAPSLIRHTDWPDMLWTVILVLAIAVAQAPAFFLDGGGDK